MSLFRGLANHNKRIESTLYTRKYETVEKAEEAIIKRIKKEGWNLEDADYVILIVKENPKVEFITVLKTEYDMLILNQK